MIMKCKKIRGIDKSVCTAEQKIAYNYAFTYGLNIHDDIQNPDIPEFAKAEGIEKVIALVIADITRRDDMRKYNIDAVLVAFRQGFRNYCENWFIANDYESIGEVFRIPYDIA